MLRAELGRFPAHGPELVHAFAAVLGNVKEHLTFSPELCVSVVIVSIRTLLTTEAHSPPRHRGHKGCTEMENEKWKMIYGKCSCRVRRRPLRNDLELTGQADIF